MNREAFRAVGKGPSDTLLLEAFLYILLFTEARLSTTASFVIEDERYSSTTFEFIRLMVQQDILEIISDSATIDEHVARRRAMYAADRSRYPIYFDSHMLKSIWIQPSVCKNTSATLAIRRDLLSVTSSVSSLFRLPLPSVDLDELSRISPYIRKGLESAPFAGVTLSLFKKFVPEVGERHTQLLIGRLLSLLHVKDYLEFSGSDIISGFPGLEYFDVASSKFPVADFRVFRLILSLCLGDSEWLHRQDEILKIIKEALVLRQSYMMRSVIHSARIIICGTIYVSELQGRVGEPLVAKMLSNLRSMFANERGFSQSGTLNEINSALLRMLRVGKHRSRDFKEYCMLAESITQDRLGSVLIVCATDIEMEALLKCAKEQLGLTYQHDIQQTGSTTIHGFGVLSKTQVFACQVEAGDEGASSLRLALAEVFSVLSPDFVILAGICYGLRPDKQNIGDIVVAKQMQAFNLQKRSDVSGVGSQIILRGARAEASPILLDRTRAAKLMWAGAPVEHGLYMSGSVLSDDQSFVKSLLSLQPEARAGEMEGHGVYAVCQREGVQWIMIKAICDWGFNKLDDNQLLAADNVMKFVVHMIGMGGLSATTMHPK